MENSKVPIITAGSLHPADGQLYETKKGDCVYLYSGYVLHNALLHLLKPPLSLSQQESQPQQNSSQSCLFVPILLREAKRLCVGDFKFSVCSP